MGGDQISIIAIPVISVIPQVCLLSRNDWCWFQQFYQLVCCAIRCFPCQNTPMASEDRKKISFPQPACTSRKLQHISESCETASPFLCIIFPFAKQLWLPFHLLVWLSLCRRGSQNSIFIIKKKSPKPQILCSVEDTGSSSGLTEISNNVDMYFTGSKLSFSNIMPECRSSKNFLTREFLNLYFLTQSQAGNRCFLVNLSGTCLDALNRDSIAFITVPLCIWESPEDADTGTTQNR